MAAPIAVREKKRGRAGRFVSLLSFDRREEPTESIGEWRRRTPFGLRGPSVEGRRLENVAISVGRCGGPASGGEKVCREEVMYPRPFDRPVWRCSRPVLYGKSSHVGLRAPCRTSDVAYRPGGGGVNGGSPGLQLPFCPPWERSGPIWQWSRFSCRPDDRGAPDFDSVPGFKPGLRT